jgi:hypothetical protein
MPSWEDLLALSLLAFGGLIGLLSPAYDDYDIGKLPDSYKINYLKKVLKKNKIKGF